MLMLLHTAGHTVGALTWKEAPNDTVAQVIAGMRNTTFEFMGRQVSMGSFYEGYGFTMIAVLLFLSVLLWILSSSPNVTLIGLTGALLISTGVIEYIYFFGFAASFSLVAGLCTLLALRRP